MSSHTTDLRDLRVEDLSVVHAINEAEAPAVGSTTERHLAHIANESAIALVAAVDGEIAGFCLVLGPGAEYASVNYRWFAERYEDFVYLDRIAIAPAYQRRGLGRAMYDEVERRASLVRPGATHFTLEVNLRPRNDPSLAFHDRLGFAEVGRQETDYGALVCMMAKPF